MPNQDNPLAVDLNHILAHTTGVWEELRGKRIFITGGTGFFGCWLLESFLWAAERLSLEAEAVVLTRDRAAFRQKAPHLADHPAITLHVGDVRNFPYPEGAFSHVIHAATNAGSKSHAAQPQQTRNIIVEGTRRVLDFGARFRGCKFLLTSSGAIYGRQPPEWTHIPEDWVPDTNAAGAPSAYSEGKRLAEKLCVDYTHNHGVDTKIARCFSFVGPYLPLDGSFAIGNFIRDGLAGKTIVITGDGTPRRTYMYAADLAIWLWTILVVGGTARPYNVGSMEDISIASAAEAVRHALDNQVDISIAKPPTTHSPPERYVPNTNRASSELGLRVHIGLDEALRRTIAWERHPLLRRH